MNRVETCTLIAFLAFALAPLQTAAQTIPAGMITNCAGCTFAHADLHGRDLHGSTIAGSTFAGADFRNANLRDVRFAGVDLQGADLDGADLRGARFSGVNLSGASMRGAKFDDIHIAGSRVTHTNLVGTDARALLSHCAGCNFSDDDLRGLDLRSISVPGGNFSRVDAEGTRFTDAALPGVRFTSANLKRASFRDAQVCYDERDDGDAHEVCIDLRGAAVDGADFRGARWCSHDATSCRPVTADELRAHTNNALAGALLP